MVKLMMTVFIWTAHALLLAPVQADVAFGPFGPRRDLDIQVRFANLKDYPQYDFFLKHGFSPDFHNASLQLKPVNSETVTSLLWRRSCQLTEVYLLAVPRGQSVNPPSREGDPGHWLTEVPSGGFRSLPLSGDKAHTPLSEQFDGCSLVYRVDLENERLQLTLLSSQAPRGWLWTVIAGLGLSAGMFLVVLLWLRRSRRLAPH